MADRLVVRFEVRATDVGYQTTMTGEPDDELDELGALFGLRAYIQKRMRKLLRLSEPAV